MRQLLSVPIFTALFFVLDQISKWIAVAYFPEMVTYNTGIAFSIPISNAAMIVATPILLFAFAYFAKKYFRFEEKLSAWTAALIMGGGLGNLADRFIRGGVVDFLDVGFWPSFNLADSFVTVGAFLIFLFHARILKEYGNSRT